MHRAAPALVAVAAASAAACFLGASLDGLANDGLAPDAAHADAGGCATPPEALCEDFDDASADGALAGWTTHASAPCVLGYNAQESTSPPNALLVGLEPDIDAGVQCYIEHPIPSAAGKGGVRHAFDLRFDRIEKDAFKNEAVVASVSFEGDDPDAGHVVQSVQLEAWHENAGDRLELSVATEDSRGAQIDFVRDPGPVPVDAGAWHRVELVVTLGAAPSAALVVDGTQGATAPFHLYPRDPAVSVALGLSFERLPLVTGWAIRYDGVAVDLTP
jgi:hypothetical protein